MNEFEPAEGRGLVTVIVDARKLRNSLAQHDPGFHVGEQGKGGIKGRYEEFERFHDRAKASGTKITQAKVTITDGKPSVVNGRHRLAVLTDRGYRYIPVSVHRSEASELRAKFGTNSGKVSGIKP